MLSRTKTQWGSWRFEKSNWTLRHPKYEIDLARMDTTGDMLDWIFQVSMKSWATREDVGYLIEALNDIFNPQSTLCSGGSNGSINSVEYLKKKYAQK